jgi:hypothetical protein
MDSMLQRVFDWCTRRVCGLTLILNVLLSVWVVRKEATFRQTLELTDSSHSFGSASILTIVFAFCSLFWHALTAVFYLRVCWSLYDVSSRLEAELAHDIDGQLGDAKFRVKDGAVVHAIVIPNYKEEMQTLRETLLVLSSHSEAQSSYDVSHTTSLCPSSLTHDSRYTLPWKAASLERRTRQRCLLESFRPSSAP